MAETQKERLMRILKCSADEADKILEADKQIDRGETMDFDLSPEEHKRAMKQANADEHSKPKTPVKRERKKNEEKGAIISALATFFSKNTEISCENVEIMNPERQISFKIGENCFEITLTQKRKPKNS